MASSTWSLKAAQLTCVVCSHCCVGCSAEWNGCTTCSHPTTQQQGCTIDQVKLSRVACSHSCLLVGLGHSHSCYIGWINTIISRPAVVKRSSLYVRTCVAKENVLTSSLFVAKRHTKNGNLVCSGFLVVNLLTSFRHITHNAQCRSRS